MGDGVGEGLVGETDEKSERISSEDDESSEVGTVVADCTVAMPDTFLESLRNA